MKGKPAFLLPAFDGKGIPVVFAANNGFAPVFAACLRSLLDHISEENCYDVVLLHTDVTEENQKTLSAMVEGCSAVSLRFFDVSEMLGDHPLRANAHISVETYFRFLIQSVLPGYDKVLYLDCDLIVNSDVAELYRTEVEGYLLAAARDPEFLGHLNGADKKIQRYILEELGMKDPSGYFQAGVLLLNTGELRKLHSQEQWLALASVPHRYNDQDVLNLCCEGRVRYLDMAWNLITDCDHTRVSGILPFAPPEIQRDYAQARLAPKIIHYAGYRKPWQKPAEDLANHFWSALRRTPYYEEMLYSMTCFATRESIREARRSRSPVWIIGRKVKRSLVRVRKKRK